MKQNHLLPSFFNYCLFNSYLKYYSSLEIENYRNELILSSEIINVNDFGAGSRVLKSNQRKISDIARTSATKNKLGCLYQKIIDYHNINSVLEFGTSLGIGTMYFALSTNDVNVTTIEACRNIYNFTKKRFDNLGINNVEFINYNFEDILANSILQPQKFDMFFIDGNHRSESVYKYFNFFKEELSNDKSIIIIDDINWSSDMYKGWKKIVNENSNCFIIELLNIGIIFKEYPYPPGKFVINLIK